MYLDYNIVLDVVASSAIDAVVPELRLRKIAFEKQGERPKRQKHRQANDRKSKVSVNKHLSESIVVTTLQPNLVLVDEGQKCVFLGELTVPWKESNAESHERKLLSYEELVAEIQEKGTSVSY